MRHHGTRTGTAVVVIFLITACSGSPTEPAPVLTAAQATARINQIVDEAIQGLTPAPTLTRRPADSDYGPCLVSNDDQRVSVSLSYRLDDIPAADLASVYRQILDRWQTAGYLTSKRKPDPISVAGGSTPDDYLLSIAPDGTDRPLISVGAPCLWPDGIPGNTYVDSYNYPVPPNTPGARLVKVPID